MQGAGCGVGSGSKFGMFFVKVPEEEETTPKKLTNMRPWQLSRPLTSLSLADLLSVWRSHGAFPPPLQSHKVMSGKRPADTSGAPGGRRQFKQTKLTFFAASSAANQAKRQPTPAASETTQETPTTTTKQPADLEEQQLETPKNTAKAAEAENDFPEEEEVPQAVPQSTLPPKSPPTTATATTTRIHITDRFGDLFTTTPTTPPTPTLLIHACNTIGSWGGGIALAFRARYPAAFKLYRAHCLQSTPDQLVGTALLIPPQKEKGDGQQHYIGCLFTSRRYGRAVDSPEQILRATGPAMRDLMRGVVEEGVVFGEVRMCRINSGLFNVPWGRSKGAIEGLELGEGEVPAWVEEGGVVRVVAYERE